MSEPWLRSDPLLYVKVNFTTAFKRPTCGCCGSFIWKKEREGACSLCVWFFFGFISTIFQMSPVGMLCLCGQPLTSSNRNSASSECGADGHNGRDSPNHTPCFAFQVWPEIDSYNFFFPLTISQSERAEVN